MADRLVGETRKMLENDLYFVVLNSALTLPDICGKVEYPDERSSKSRYIFWYDEKIGKYEKNPEDKNDSQTFRDAASGMGSLLQSSLKVTAEFKARKKQYEYYCNKLLSFGGMNGDDEG